MLNNYLIALRIEDDHFKIPPPKKTHEKDKILPCSAPCWAAQRPWHLPAWELPYAGCVLESGIQDRTRQVAFLARGLFGVCFAGLQILRAKPETDQINDVSKNNLARSVFFRLTTTRDHFILGQTFSTFASYVFLAQSIFPIIEWNTSWILAWFMVMVGKYCGAGYDPSASGL